jgi:hypothetical protein
MDVIGSGEDLVAIQEYAAKKGLAWNWLGGKDHADGSMHGYQVKGGMAGKGEEGGGV